MDNIKKINESITENLSSAENKKSFSYNEKESYKALIKSTANFIFIGNLKTGKFRYPLVMVNLFGFPSEVIQNPLPLWEKIVHKADWEKFYESNMEIVSGEKDSHNIEFRVKTVEGDYIWMKCCGNMVRDKEGNPSTFAGVISHLEEKNKIDNVTRLLNITEFSKNFQKKIDSGLKNIGMVILGIDNFKQVNDFHDRETGDKVLQAIARIIQSNLLCNEEVYRLDGDNFGLIVKDADEEKIVEIYEKIKTEFVTSQIIEKRKLLLTISGGCSIYPKDGNSYLELYKYTNYTLESSKKDGKNKMTFFTKEIIENKSRHLEVLYFLKRSIANDFYGFDIVYQPQISSKTEKIKGVEALLRWKDEKLGMISPMEFVPVLEDTGLIVPVGRWILRNSLKQCKEWLKYNPDFTMSVNISFIQLLDKDFLNDLKEIIKELDIPTRNIILELTESCSINSMGFMKNLYDELKDSGIRVALDDFGTGYSSLGVLKEIAADIVKIDRIFVRDILKSKFDMNFIKFITAICNDVDIEVCLEGVETKEEYNLVKDIGIDYIQGYYFGKPQSAEEIENNFLIEK